MGLALAYNCGRTPKLMTNICKICLTSLFMALSIGLSQPALATEPGIAKEIKSFGALLAKEDRVYFEGTVQITYQKPAAKKEQHTFSTWYFTQGKKYKTFYENGESQQNSVWDGSHCFTWMSKGDEKSKGYKATKPEWHIGADHMQTPSDFVLDGLNGYRGLLNMFDFSNPQDKGPLRIFDTKPSAANSLKDEIPDNAIMRILFDRETGMIVATYQEIPERMSASFKVVNHWFDGDPAIVLRTPVNVDFE